MELNPKEERPAYIQFETRPVESKSASLSEGRAVCVDVDYVLVTPPYSKDLFEDKAENWLKKMEMNVNNGRIPLEWLSRWKKQYEMWKDGKEAPLDGTDIKNWSAATPAQVKNLLSAGIKTIEDLALANDEALRRIGMGGMDLRNKANAWLKGASDQGKLVQENAQLKKDIGQLTGTVETLQAQMAKLTNDYAVAKGEHVPIKEAITLDDIMDDSDTAPIDNLADLKSQYEAKFGKKPHHMMTERTLTKALSA